MQTIHSKEDTTITIEEYLNCLVKDGTILESDIDKIGDLTYITVEGEYIFQIKENEEKKGDILIIYEGTAKNKKPVIYKTEVTNATSTITVSLSTKYAEGATYRYYIKDTGEGEYGKAIAEIKESSYTFEKLIQEKTYYIKIEVESTNGQKSTKEMVGITGELTIEATGIEVDKIGWTDQNVIVKIPIIEGYEIEYQLGEEVNINGIWEKTGTKVIIDEKEYIQIPDIESNTKVFYRYSDGTNGSKNYGIKEIKNIDKTEARVTTALSVPEASKTTKGFTLTIGATDAESGIGKIIWYYKKDGEESYTKVEEAKYNYHTINDEQSGTTIEVSDSLVVDNVTNGKYYAYAEIYNVAGNKTTTSEINFNLKTIEKAQGATIDPTGWTNGKVKVYLPTKTGYTTQYQVAQTVNINGTWKTQGTTVTKNGTQYLQIPDIEENTKVFYRYNDGTNAGDYETLTISNIDKQGPTIGTLTGSTATGNTGTVSATNVQDAGGCGAVSYYINTKNTIPEGATWTSFTGNKFDITVSSNTTYYVWVKDNLGNISEQPKSCSVSGIVAKVSSVNYASTASLIAGNKVTPSLTYSGTAKSKTFSSSNENIATVNESTGEVTGVSVGVVTITVTIKNFDGTTAGKWQCQVSVSEYLQYYGDLKTSRTGGFNLYRNGINEYYDTSSTSNGLFSIANGSGYSFAWVSKNEVDITNAKTIEFYVTGYQNCVGLSQYVSCGISNNQISDDNFVVKSSFTDTCTELCKAYTKTLSIDVKNINKGRLKIYTYHGTEIHPYTVYLTNLYILAKP